VLSIGRDGPAAASAAASIVSPSRGRPRRIASDAVRRIGGEATPPRTNRACATRSPSRLTGLCLTHAARRVVAKAWQPHHGVRLSAISSHPFDNSTRGIGTSISGAKPGDAWPRRGGGCGWHCGGATGSLKLTERLGAVCRCFSRIVRRVIGVSGSRRARVRRARRGVPGCGGSDAAG
jgi:hypothetical protein